MPLRRTARGLPYHFAGRGEELAELGHRLAVVKETGDASDGLALITGVPGVGKTTLARRFAKSNAETSGVSMIEGGVSRLNDPLNLFLAMGAAIGESERFKKIGDVDSRLKSGAVGVGVARGSAEYEHVRTTLGFEALLQISAEQGLWKGKALVVVIDELQQLKEHQADLLADLHQGLHQCPILVVGAGLQNTRAVLSNLGISRIADGIELGPLHRDATREVFSESLIDFDREAPPHVVERLAEASYDFPQHIHCYLTAALDAIDDSAGWRDPDVLAEVLKEGDRLRARHYNDRLQAMMEGHERMLPLVAEMRDRDVLTMRKSVAAAAIETKGGDGWKTVADAVKHGVLTEGEEGRVGFGIPSFHNHMMMLLDTYERELKFDKSPRTIQSTGQ